jgi:hypothetical protein
MYKAMKEFRQLEADLKTTQLRLPAEELASYEPAAAAEEGKASSNPLCKCMGAGCPSRL